MRSELITSAEYFMDANSIIFDKQMVDFNREYDAGEYESTKLSIVSIGQQHPIHINDESLLCENGRHRVKICSELGILVKCINVDGHSPKNKRIDLYNMDQMSGRILTVSQKAVQAHKYSTLTGTLLDTAAKKYNVSVRAVYAVNSISGLGRHDIIKKLLDTGFWENAKGVKMKDVRRIAAELKAEAEDIVVAEEDVTIDYETLIKTERGKSEFWKLRTLSQMSNAELNKILVEFVNMKYKLKVNAETGEITEQLSEPQV
jgi:hypothetical protein